MKMRGADAVVEALRREGVEVIFGHPGGAILPIYDALYDSGLKHVLVRHEQGAAHMADGYARATGKAGVCFATSGPGALNTVTGLATAYMDSIPVVAITGQVPTTKIGTDAFQEADVLGVTMPVVKHNYLVSQAGDLTRIIKEAFHIAASGRPGPVVIDIPVDIQRTVREFEFPESIGLRSYKPTYMGHPHQIQKAADLIAAAERPILYIGGGIIAAGAYEELRELARRCQIPVTWTLMAKGAFPEDHELALGMLGMHGTAYANYAVHHCDLLIAVGTRFDDRVTGKLEEFVPYAKIIHIDIDPAEIGKNLRPCVPIVGNAKDVLAGLLQKVGSKRHPLWLEQIRTWQAQYPLKYEWPADEVPCGYILEELGKATQGEAIVATDVGQHQMWTALLYRSVRPRGFLTSGGLGTMGYGFPAAIGAQFGRPNDLVLAIVGDGGFQMTLQELGTAVEHRLPIKVAIINNGFLGMVRQWQELFSQRRYSATRLASQPDYVKLAEAYGAVGFRATRKEEVRTVIEKGMAVKDGPCLMEFCVAREENVMPMIPSGGTIHQMILSDPKFAARLEENMLHTA